MEVLSIRAQRAKMDANGKRGEKKEAFKLTKEMKKILRKVRNFNKS